jgi:hypothetical protein
MHLDAATLLSILEKFGIGGLALALAWALFKQLSRQYEHRIEALEKSSARCEADRIKIRDELVSLQHKVIDLLSKEEARQ